MTRPRAVVLLSGGMDSATTLAVARRDGHDSYALSFRYGQRHAVELEAARHVAVSLGAVAHQVLDIDLRRLTYLYDIFHGELNTLYASTAAIERSVLESDLLIGAVYVSGRRAPVLVPEEMVARMEPGSVIVDVAVDQGGCVETIHPTTHADPTYVVDGVVHYGVANMPGAVARTSTYALTNATLPYARRLARLGPVDAVRKDPQLRSAVNAWKGKLTHRGVAEAFGLPAHDVTALVA